MNLFRSAVFTAAIAGFVAGLIMTAMPAINAIPAVVAAPPGIVSYPDLPLPLPRGLVRL